MINENNNERKHCQDSKYLPTRRKKGKASYYHLLSHGTTAFVFLSFFLSFFLQKSAVNVKEVMDTWTIQMGLPVVTIKRIEDNKATADQKVFLIVPGAKPNRSSPFK